MQDKLARARRHKLDPASFLLTMEQWGERLDATFEEFNADPQNGKMLAGASPFEAWRAGLDCPNRSANCPTMPVICSPPIASK